MTDTDLLDWLERTGAMVCSGTDDALFPQSYSVCVNRVTPWVTKDKLRDAIMEAKRIQETTHPKAK